jgi:hypothetical protein
MIRWRNVFIACLVSAWAHGLASAVCEMLGADALRGFCVGAWILSVLALLPLGTATYEQSESYALRRAVKAEEEARSLRAQLADCELKEPLP